MRYFPTEPKYLSSFSDGAHNQTYIHLWLHNLFVSILMVIFFCNNRATSGVNIDCEINVSHMNVEVLFLVYFGQ